MSRSLTAWFAAAVQVAVVGGDSLLGQAIAEEFRLAGGKVCAIGTEEATCDVIIKGQCEAS